MITINGEYRDVMMGIQETTKTNHNTVGPYDNLDDVLRDAMYEIKNGDSKCDQIKVVEMVLGYNYYNI